MFQSYFTFAYFRSSFRRRGCIEFAFVYNEKTQNANPQLYVGGTTL